LAAKEEARESIKKDLRAKKNDIRRAEGEIND
jgi:hypothetical protein